MYVQQIDSIMIAMGAENKDSLKAISIANNTKAKTKEQMCALSFIIFPPIIVDFYQSNKTLLLT